MPKPLTHDEFDETVIATAAHFVAFQFRGVWDRQKSPDCPTQGDAEAFGEVMLADCPTRPVMIYAVTKEGRETLVRNMPRKQGTRT